MGRCKYCGGDTLWRMTVCHPCKRKWKERRIAAFNQATSELGALTADNHKAIIKRTKQLEKQG
jgi:hypothetical protein